MQRVVGRRGSDLQEEQQERGSPRSVSFVLNFADLAPRCVTDNRSVDLSDLAPACVANHGSVDFADLCPACVAYNIAVKLADLVPACVPQVVSVDFADLTPTGVPDVARRVSSAKDLAYAPRARFSSRRPTDKLSRA